MLWSWLTSPLSLATLKPCSASLSPDQELQCTRVQCSVAVKELMLEDLVSARTDTRLSCLFNFRVALKWQLMSTLHWFLVALVVMPAAIKSSCHRPPHVTPEKIPTYPCQVEDQMGWSYGEKNLNLCLVRNIRNSGAQTNFWRVFSSMHTKIIL